MNKETSEALEASIKHHEYNAVVYSFDDADTAEDSCALCKLFFNLGCIGCPVSEKTGHKWCIDTPYYTMLMAEKSDDIRAFNKHAQSEVDFLKALRE